MTSALDKFLAEAERVEKAASDLIRPIPGFYGYYADCHGSVWSINSRWGGWHKLSPHPTKHGYLRVRIASGTNERKHYAAHRLVAQAFHGLQPTAHHEVRHLDGSRVNNRPDNLCWGTRSENAKDRARHGTERAPENGRKSAKQKTFCKRGHLLSETRDARRVCGACKPILRKEYYNRVQKPLRAWIKPKRAEQGSKP